LPRDYAVGVRYSYAWEAHGKIVASKQPRTGAALPFADADRWRGFDRWRGLVLVTLSGNSALGLTTFSK
jgi:hypothetical protein